MNWDDLRIARAVYETGSYAAAGARLRINETTVARRLSRLQDDLGVTLFEAVDGVRRPTMHCEEIVALAAAMADQAERIAKIGDTELGLVGRRRIATTDSIATEVLAPNTAAFLAEHPGLTIDFLASTENVNFSRWEADIAIRLRKPDKGDFVISKLADIALYLFEPAARTTSVPDLVCAYPADLYFTPESQYLTSVGLQQHATCTAMNLLVLKKLIESRRCSGILPSYMCADLLDDQTLTAKKLPEPREAWLLVQSHLKHDAATRAVIDWIKECFAALDAGPPGV
jgi:DNA-binding transcriptional LysR family regulator